MSDYHHRTLRHGTWLAVMDLAATPGEPPLFEQGHMLVTMDSLPLVLDAMSMPYVAGPVLGGLPDWRMYPVSRRFARALSAYCDRQYP